MIQPYQVTRSDWFRAEQFYVNVLLEYQFEELTPATLYRMQSDLKTAQFHQVKCESHHVWKIPLKIIYEKYSNNIGILPDLDKSVVGIEGVSPEDCQPGPGQTQVFV